MMNSTEIHEKIAEDGFVQRVSEMGTAEAVPDLPVPADFMASLSDDDPMFVTVEVEPGWSKSKRLWRAEHVRHAVDTVNKSRPGGNLGHPLIDPTKYASEFPEPQVVWVAAKTKDVGGKLVGQFKGYVLKSAKAREYLKLGLIDGVSWFGDSKMKPVQGGYEVLDFNLETIDFARKGRSGMSSRVLALTGEQSTQNEGGKVEPKDVAALAPEEIKTHAPLVYKAIQDEVAEPLNSKIGEQTVALEAAKPEIDTVAKLKELLKAEDGENVLEKVTNLMERIEDASKSEIRAFVNDLIGKKVKTERGRNLVARLVGEMADDYDGTLDDDLKKKIEEDFNTKVDGDDVVKSLIGEMADWTDDDKGKGSTTGGSSLGGRSQSGASRGRNDGKSERRSEGGGVVIRQVRL